MDRQKYLCIIILSGLLLAFSPIVYANNYTADLGLITSRTIYSVNDRVEIRGNLYLSNYSDNGTLLVNHTGLPNSGVNISFISKTTNASVSSYSLNTTSDGSFYSRNDYNTTAVLVTSPATPGDYFIKANYTDPNSGVWWTKTEVQVVNQTIDKLFVSSDKSSYSTGGSLQILVESIKEVGDDITYVANVTANITIRNSSKSILATFSCITGSNGKCTINTTAPSSYGNYILEVNNFKSYSSFEVVQFSANIQMKDELGQSIKYVFSTADQASVEVEVLTNSTADIYTFSGVIKNSAGSSIKTITSTVLNSTNSYLNRFGFTVDAISFSPGTYFVEVNVSKTAGQTSTLFTSFQVSSWDMSLKKKEIDSGFDYEYSAFPNKNVTFEIYPSWRANGSIISEINTTTSMNISVIDDLNNQLATYNASWNVSCGKEGCYRFSLLTPANKGGYYVSVLVSHNNEQKSLRQRINVINASIFAQSTDKEGILKELFGTNDNVYITLSSKNSSSNVNLSDASVVSVVFSNGTEISYTKVNNFSLVNSSNSILEWAWNVSSQRLKLDTPSAGGLYTVYISAENGTIAISSRFIINPYDVCIAPKSTAGQFTATDYYISQFKTTDTIYFQLKVSQSNTTGGRASFTSIGSDIKHGFSQGCSDKSSTQQVVTNATITIEEVTNVQSGKTFSLNKTESVCQAEDNKGGYTCTVKPSANWDGGRYGVKFKIVGQDGTTDTTYGGFEARLFYIYAYTNNWYNKPGANINLTVDMYQAGSNWWSNYGSGGLSGTVKLEKIEYQGTGYDWFSTPILYNYNVSAVNTSTVTNGRASISLPVNITPTPGQWKTGYYSAVLKGTDSDGNSDYGYAWFSIRRWDVYSTPIDCSNNMCNSAYQISSKNNVSLYVTVSNAGEWGQGGNDLGGNVTISVKKIRDCRKWPCTDLNTSAYTSTSIIVNRSSGWYSGGVNSSYLINLTPTSGSWGTGYWEVVLDVNGTETGNGWFNTVSFYAESQPTNFNGSSWKYNIKNNEQMYFKITTSKSQKGGYYYDSYSSSDYINTTISSGVLRSWDSTNFRQIEYNYPQDINFSIVGGGTTINGSRIVNVTFANGNWPSGYYWGELTLKNSDNETANANLWFQVIPFRVDITTNQYSVGTTECINGTLNVRDPDWSSNTILNNTSHNITNIVENTWTGGSSSSTSYTNYLPANLFNGTANLSVCPNSGSWGSGSWGNYHYLTIKVKDKSGSTGEGWMSFRAVPFSVNIGNIIGGNDVSKSNNIVVPITISTPSGAPAIGNLTRLYQWRYNPDTYKSTEEKYDFTIGSCNSTTSSKGCEINGTKNITIYPPASGWQIGYNYLQSEFKDTGGSIVQSDSSIWFNAKDAYTGFWYNSDQNGNWKYYFAQNENLTVRLEVRDTANSFALINVTKVEYALSSNCWTEACRSYSNAEYSISGQASNNLSITGSGIIVIKTPSANWTRGAIFIRATISGPNGTKVIAGTNIVIKDMTAPSISVQTPLINQTVNSSFYINLTTTKNGTCSLEVYDYSSFYSYSNCNLITSSNSTQIREACNNTKYGFNSTTYYYEYISKDYKNWNKGGVWGWSSGSTGLVTNGTNHYYLFDATNLGNQSYGIRIYCNDEDWNSARGYVAIKANMSNTTGGSGSSGSSSPSVSLTEWPMFRLSQKHTAYYSSNVSIKNFTLLWTFNTSAFIRSSPAVVNGIVYFGSENNNTYALNATTGTQIWNYTVLGGNISVGGDISNKGISFSSPAIYQGIVYIQSNGGLIYALNATNGNQIWNYTLGDRSHFYYSSANVINGVVYIGGGENNKTFALNATTGAHIWNYTTVASVVSTPAVVNGIVYFGSNDGKVYALNATNGSYIWNYTTPFSSESISSSPAIESDILYIGSSQQVYSLNATNGNLIWNYTILDSGGVRVGTLSSPAIANNIVYLGATNKQIYALNATNGSKIWNYTTALATVNNWASPSVIGDVLYIGSNDKNVYAFNSTTGSLLWNYTTKDWVQSSPILVNTMLYVGSLDGRMYAFNATG